MEGLFTIVNFVTLAMLTLLQAVLGFDNLLDISLSQKELLKKNKSADVL